MSSISEPAAPLTAAPALCAGCSPASGGHGAAHDDSIERRNGFTRVTDNGRPLYCFVEDGAPGATTGRDVHGFGGACYPATPRATLAHAE